VRQTVIIHHGDGETIELRGTGYAVRCAARIAEDNHPDARWALKVLNQYGHLVEHEADAHSRASARRPGRATRAPGPGPADATVALPVNGSGASEPPKLPARPERDNVIDLIDALKRSLAQSHPAPDPSDSLQLRLL
jgi:hypothetical protein